MSLDWSLILGALLLGIGGVMILVVIAAIVIAIIREARKGRRCERCGHEVGTPYDGSVQYRTLPREEER